jgi:hypothetical protein
VSIASGSDSDARDLGLDRNVHVSDRRSLAGTSLAAEIVVQRLLFSQRLAPRFLESHTAMGQWALPTGLPVPHNALQWTLDSAQKHVLSDRREPAAHLVWKATVTQFAAVS